MKLGTLLLRNAAITLSQLETALRTQVVYGGRLGTNLVELGFIDVDTLTEYLAESLELPVATQQMFESTPKSDIDQFGPELARRFESFPLAAPPNANLPDGALALAMVNPRGEAYIERIEHALNRTIAPHVAPELRIYYYLEKHYGITRKARFVRVGSRDGTDNPDERRRMQPMGGIAMPPKVTFSPKRSTSLAGATTSAERAITTTSGADISFQSACDAIDQAEHRDDIADILMSYARGRFGVAAMFLLRDANAMGWCVYREDTSVLDKPFEELSLPLGPASLLQLANDNAIPYQGRPVSPGKPTERKLWSALSIGKEPHDLAVMPILVKRRVVNLVYAHGIGGAPLERKAVKGLEELCERAGASYYRLITSSKTSARSATGK